MVVYIVKEQYGIGEAAEILREKTDIEIKECGCLEQALQEGQKDGEEEDYERQRIRKVTKRRFHNFFHLFAVG